MSRPTLIFIYNAESGLMHAALDTLHKWLSPSTYACQLCRVGFHGFGMRRELRDYLQGLGMELLFLHKDDYRAQVPMTLALPVVLLREGDSHRVLLDSAQINTCQDLPQLLAALDAALA